MADSAEDIRAALEQQIADLKSEMGKMGKQIRARAADAADSASEAYDDMRGRASDMARQVRDQAQVVSEAARDNPGTAVAVVATVGLVGFILGLLAGGITARGR